MVVSARWQMSLSAFLTHSFNVCGTQPILVAIGPIASYNNRGAGSVLLHHAKDSLVDFR